MDYTQIHLLDWLKNHPCITISCLEKNAQITEGSLRHFLKERRNLSQNNFNRIVTVLSGYGYIPLSNE